MTAGELVVMFAATLGGVAVTGMLIAVLLIWFRHAMKQVALLLAGVGAFVLLLTLLTRLSSDALAMLVGGVVFMLCSIPAILLAYGESHPGSAGYRRAHAREQWGLDAEEPAGYLDDGDWEYQTERTREVDESGLVCEESFTLLVPKRQRRGVTVERANHKQLTGGHNERR